MPIKWSSEDVWLIIADPRDTPADAIRTFFSSGMDTLVLGSFPVEK